MAVEEHYQRNKTWYVYRHTAPNGKVYIGITCKPRPQDRWEKGNGYNRCTYFGRAIIKYGWDNIKHEIILSGVTKSEAIYTEKYLIRWYKIHKLSYNITDGGDGTHGRVISEETRHKMSISNKGLGKGKVLSEETKELIAKAFRKPILQIDRNSLEVINEYPSIKDAAICIGKPGKENNIAHVLHNRKPTAFGYIWRFKYAK